ncbi:oxidoreductase [Streptomyces xiamenensis]
MSDFAATDRRAVDAGCAVVEVHSANGYLLHQFFATGAQPPHRCLRQQHPLHHRSHRRHRRRTLRTARLPRQHRHRHHRHRGLLPGPHQSRPCQRRCTPATPATHN